MKLKLKFLSHTRHISGAQQSVCLMAALLDSVNSISTVTEGSAWQKDAALCPVALCVARFPLPCLFGFPVSQFGVWRKSMLQPRSALRRPGLHQQALAAA